MSTVTRRSSKLAPRAMRAEAAAWIAKLHGPERSTELEADFQAWLKADAEHARAFENLTEIWEALGSANVGGLPRLVAVEPIALKSRRPRLAAAALVAGLVIAIGAFWILRGETYVTGVGEQRVVSLEDGTRVSLNSRTRVEVRYGERERRVRLDRGEAFFEVARDTSRPFVVMAGERTVTALGTSFVVRYEPDHLTVMLVEGKVALFSPPPLAGQDKEAASSVMLVPGQRLTFTRNSIPKIDTPRPEAAMAWRRGEVILDNTPLADAVAEMNRYERSQIVLDDSRFKDLRVSGVYKTGDAQGFAQAVSVAYGLKTVASGEEIHLTSR